MDPIFEELIEEAAKDSPYFQKKADLDPAKKKLLDKFERRLSEIQDENKAFDYVIEFAGKYNMTSDDMCGYIPARIAYSTIPDIFSIIDATPDFPVE